MCGLFWNRFIWKLGQFLLYGLYICIGRNLFFGVTVRYVVHMLKLQCHYASFDKFHNLNMWIVLALLYSKVRAIFAMRHVHLFGEKWGEKFVFSVTAQYVIHKLKLQYHYVSLGEFYKLNVWIVPASHRFIRKVGEYLLFPVSLYIYFYEISRFLRIFYNSIIEGYINFFYTTSYSSDRYSLGNSV